MSIIQKIVLLLSLLPISISYTMEDEESRDIVPSSQPYQTLSRLELFKLQEKVLLETRRGKLTQTAFPVELPEPLTRIISTYDKTENSDYHNSMRLLLNKLELMAVVEHSSRTQFNRQTFQQFYSVDVIDIEKLIQGQENKSWVQKVLDIEQGHEQSMAQAIKDHKQALQQAKQNQKKATLESLPFWSRYPKVTFTAGTVIGGLFTGLLAYYGMIPLQASLEKTAEAAANT